MCKKKKHVSNSKSYGYFSGLESLLSNTNDFSVSTAALCWDVESKWDEAGRGGTWISRIEKAFIAISTVAREPLFEKPQLLLAKSEALSFKRIVCYEKYNRILSTVLWKHSVLVIRFNIIILINSAESHLIGILSKILCSFSVSAIYLHIDVDPSGCAVECVGMRPRDYWDWRFEFHQWQEYLSLLTVVYFKVEVSALDWSHVQRRQTAFRVSVCVHEVSKMGKP